MNLSTFSFILLFLSTLHFISAAPASKQVGANPNYSETTPIEPFTPSIPADGLISRLRDLASKPQSSNSKPPPALIKGIYMANRRMLPQLPEHPLSTNPDLVAVFGWGVPGFKLCLLTEAQPEGKNSGIDDKKRPRYNVHTKNFFWSTNEWLLNPGERLGDLSEVIKEGIARHMYSISGLQSSSISVQLGGVYVAPINRLKGMRLYSDLPKERSLRPDLVTVVGIDENQPKLCLIADKTQGKKPKYSFYPDYYWPTDPLWASNPGKHLGDLPAPAVMYLNNMVTNHLALDTYDDNPFKGRPVGLPEEFYDNLHLLQSLPVLE